MSKTKNFAPKTENEKFLILDTDGDIDSFHSTMSEAVDYVDDCVDGFGDEDEDEGTFAIYKLVREVRVTKKVETTVVNL